MVVALREIRYPATATLSVDSFHDRLTLDGDVAVPATPLGVEGDNVSPAGGVRRGKWELYNIAKDRTETNDLARSDPDRVEKMANQWNAWAKRAKVYPKKRVKTP